MCDVVVAWGVVLVLGGRAGGGGSHTGGSVMAMCGEACVVGPAARRRAPSVRHQGGDGAPLVSA